MLDHDTNQPDHDVFGVADFAAAASGAVQQLCDYVRHSMGGQGPVTDCCPMAEIYERLDLHRWLRQGGMTVEHFRDFLDAYLQLSTRLHHPGYLAHQVATPDAPAALADLIHGVINNPMAVYEMGPAASTIEHAVINWMLRKVGWVPEPVQCRWRTGHAAGALTHGGSLANFTALLAARAAAAPDAWRRGTPRDLVILAPRTCHYSVSRAAAMLGLGTEAVWPLAVDERDVLVADGIAEAIGRVQKAGKRCMAVVVNACATATGLYDPIAEVAEQCRTAKVWLHVDGAHGASALLSARERVWLRGIEHADSMVWDAHKMLRTSALCAAVLVRDGTRLAAAFQQEASYLLYDEEQPPGIDYIERTVECTKSALGLKLFLNLACRGEGALGAYVEGRYAAARRFFRLIEARAGFVCPFEPQSNILVFRYGDSDELQTAIRERLLRDRTFYLSSAVVAGRRHLRMAVMSPSTSDATIEALLDAIVAAARALGHSS